RSDKPLIAAASKRVARWEKILFESAQQARRLRPPAMAVPVSSERAFAQSSAQCKILLSERREAPSLREVLADLPECRSFGSGAKLNQNSGASASEDRVTTCALAVGPEGGGTDHEIAFARSAGFLEASLGDNILRTETAVL